MGLLAASRSEGRNKPERPPCATDEAALRVVEAILFLPGDAPRFLMLRRSRERGGWWQGVTGTAEPGESLEDAVRREVAEETGVTGPARMIDLDFAFPFEFSRYGGGRTVSAVKHSFGVQVDGERVKLSDEHDSSVWVGFEDALRLLTWEDNKEALRRLRAFLDRERG